MSTLFITIFGITNGDKRKQTDWVESDGSETKPQAEELTSISANTDEASVNKRARTQCINEQKYELDTHRHDPIHRIFMWHFRLICLSLPMGRKKRISISCHYIVVNAPMQQQQQQQRYLRFVYRKISTHIYSESVYTVKRQRVQTRANREQVTDWLSECVRLSRLLLTIVIIIYHHH